MKKIMAMMLTFVLVFASVGCQQANDAADAAESAAGSVAEDVSDAGDDLAEELSSVGDEIADEASDAVESATDAVSDAVESATDAVSDAVEDISEKVVELTGKDITAGFVTDVGGIDDKSFNQSTWEGYVRYATDKGLSEDSYSYVASKEEADYFTNLSTFADEEVDLIIASGFLFQSAMAEVAKSYPEQKFLLIDSVVEDENVASAVFAEHEGSFLVGVAAALKAESEGKDTVGFLGGMDLELIQKFEAGFEQGVHAVNPDMKVLVEYAGDFAAPDVGATQSAKMFDEGAYVIYHAAGGTGNGLFKEAKSRVENGEDVWAIGVDKDQYEDGIYADGKSVVLTSMLKRVDEAAYQVSDMVANDKFNGKDVLVFTLANNGVSIPDENPNLDPAWITKINSFRDKIVNGEITVEPVPSRLK